MQSSYWKRRGEEEQKERESEKTNKTHSGGKEWLNVNYVTTM